MRVSPAIYIVVVAVSFGLSTLLTRTIAPNDNLLASLLDVAFVIAGVAGLEVWAWRRRRAVRPPVPGTLAFLFTDVEDSTGLLRELGSEYGALIADQERIVREAGVRNGGKVVDAQGDAVFAVFTTAAGAVRAAAEVQRALRNNRVRLRIGIHTGEASHQGGRYLGLAVHRAARICALASGGAILVSASTHALLVDDEVSGVELVDAGAHRLRGLERPVQLYEAVVDGVPAKRLAGGAPRTEPFAGREDELAQAAGRTLKAEP